MSAITFDWTSAEAGTKASVPVKVAENYSRAEEFRLAVDRYVADYVAHQARRADRIGQTVATRLITGDLAKVTGWLRRLLKATREVWFFSHEISRDWRQAR